MKICIIINQHAGYVLSHDRSEIERLIVAGLHPHGHHVDVRFVPPDALEAEIDGVMSGQSFDIVAVGGGDGTIRSSAVAAMRHGATLGILPLGTLNLLARDLSIPVDVESSIAVLGTGAVRVIDAASVNGRIFLCNSMIGLTTKHSSDRQSLRRASLPRRVVGYIRSALAILSHRHHLSIAIDDGDEVRRVRVLTMAVTNNAYDEGAGFGFRRCRLDCGVLTAYLSRHRNGWALGRAFMAALFGRWSGDPMLQTVTASALRITTSAKSIRVSNDGEIEMMKPPLEYRVHPQALRVIAPVETQIEAATIAASSGGVVSDGTAAYG